MEAAAAAERAAVAELRRKPQEEGGMSFKVRGAVVARVQLTSWHNNKGRPSFFFPRQRPSAERVVMLVCLFSC